MGYLIVKAKKWADNIWRKAAKDWKNRKQDHNYRDFVARPNIYNALKSLKPLNNGVFLDIGCGDGSETIYFKNCLTELGNTGKIYGFDPQENFIRIAKKRKDKTSKLSLCFGDDSFDEFIQKYRLTERVGLAISMFVLQEIPDIDNLLNNIDKCLSRKGIAIFLLVHPDFAEAISRKGALKIKEDLTPNNLKASWRFVAEYPIVEEHGRTFFVPYFHRTIEDYKKIMKRYFGKVKFVNLKPKIKDIKFCQKKKKTPFYNHRGNVYYPEIINVNSSLIIVVSR